MPLRVPHSLKSLGTIAQEPRKVSNKIELIMCLDLAGKKGNDIAAALGLSVARISIIRNSPLYQQEIVKRREALLSEFRDKQTDKMVMSDPVELALKEAALSAAKKKIALMTDGKSEFVQLAAAGDILDRAGYKAHQEKTKLTVEVTDKMATRFEEALRHGTGNARQSRITLTTEDSG